MRLTEDQNIECFTLFEHARTEKAILVSETGDKTTAVWLPLSQVEIHSTDKGGIWEIDMPVWLAKDKGLA
jgi:hypothetical protein